MGVFKKTCTDQIWNDLALRTNKFNKPHLLPVTDDLKKLKEYFDTQLPKYTQKLSACTSYANWRNLCEVTWHKFLLFNKRRSSETNQLVW